MPIGFCCCRTVGVMVEFPVGVFVCLHVCLFDVLILRHCHQSVALAHSFSMGLETYGTSTYDSMQTEPKQL